MKKTRRSWFARRVGAELLRRVTAWLCFLAMLVSDASPWAGSLVAAQAADIQGMVEQRVLTCGLTEHIHDDSCYEEVLTCGLEESDENVTISRKYVSNFKIHTHDASCYNGAGELTCGWFEGEYYHTHNEYCRDENGNLVCGLETKKPHTHYEECFTTDRVLICELPEDPGHIHTEDCYQTRTELTCGQEETAGHTHSESCYTAQAVLSCGQEASEEHQHSEACYTMESILSCGQEEIPAHSHSEACYATFTDVICGQEERAGHTHGDSCYEMIQTLTCTLPTSTHKHTDECFDGSGHAICGKVEVPTFTSTADNWKETRTITDEGHQHTAECYSKAAEPSCGLTEHVHTDDCYETVRVMAVEENSDQQNEDGQNAEAPEIAIIDEETTDPATADAQDEVIIQTTEDLTEPATEDPTEELTETPKEEPTEDLTEESAEAPTAEASENPTEELTETLTEEPTENLTEEPVEAPTEEASEEPTEEPVEAPTEKATEDSNGENPDQEPTEELTENPTEKSTEDPSEATVDSPAEEPTEDFTEEPGETPAEESNGASLEEPGEEDQAAQEDNSNDNLSEETNNDPTDESKEKEATDPSNASEEEAHPDESVDTSEEENQEARVDEDGRISEEESLPLDVAKQLDDKLMAADEALAMVETNALTVNASRPVTYDDDYVSILASATGNKAPIIIAQNNVTSSGNGVTILGSWTVDGTTGNSTTTLFATLTDYPELGAADQLSFYAIEGRNKNNLQLASTPLLDDLEIGNTAMATLSTQGSNGTYGIALVKSPAKMEAGKVLTPDSPYEQFSLTGKIPADAIVEVVSAEAEIDNEELLAACDITIYANKAQQAQNTSWQPEGEAIQVTLQNQAFGNEELNVYHFPAEGGSPELIDTVTANNGWITFAATSFSVFAVTRSIEKNVTIDGATYKITVSYDSRAGIPDGAELAVSELPKEDYLDETAAALRWTENDTVFYTKFLDISIVKDGIEIEPMTPVEVTVELLDANESAEALEVVHFGENGAEKLESTANADGVVTFTTHSFSAFGFGSILRTLRSWANDTVSFALQGFSTLLNLDYTAVSVPLEEGLQTISAYNITSNGLLGNLLNLWIKINVNQTIGQRESVAVYSLYHGAVQKMLAEEAQGGSVTVSLNGADGFALVLDTGYRHKNLDLTDIVLDGLLPKEAQARAVAAQPEGLEGKLLAAYDISIDENGAEYQPDEDHPVDVTIRNVEISGDGELHVWHIQDDGTEIEITDFTVEDDTVRFTANGFSVYAITETTKYCTYTFFVLNEYGEYVEYALSTDQGAVTFTQVVKNGESLLVPQSPVNDSEPDTVFIGWYRGTPKEGGGIELEADPFDFDHLPAVTEDMAINLYAQYKRYVNVVFHGQYDENAGEFPVIAAKRGELTGAGLGSATVGINDVTAGYDDGTGEPLQGMVFYGWSTTPVQRPGEGLSDKITEDSITIEANTDLYPLYQAVRWLSFSTGSHATYYGPVSYPVGTGPEKLDVPEREGYIFTGWYVDVEIDENHVLQNRDTATKVAHEDGGLIEDAFNNEIGVSVQDNMLLLSNNVTLYAGWEPAEVTYAINIWVQQSLESEYYDFREQFILTGKTGEEVTVPEDYQKLNEAEVYNRLHSGEEVTEANNPYTGCKFLDKDSETVSKTIERDGSTTFDIYYNLTEDAPEQEGPFTLTFMDSERTEVSRDLTEAGVKTELIEAGIDLASSNYIIDDPASGREGYTFNGWYADPSCTVRVFFTDDEAYQTHDGNKLLYHNMPASNLTLFAGWAKIKYLVQIDPNRGALYWDNGSEGTGSTWFMANHGELISEYPHVTREYEESPSGTYYYVNHDYAYANTHENADRKTYYTTDISLATSYTTYQYEPNLYQYDGWYEVNLETGEETLYDFATPVTHDTYLKLHWRKTGAFYVVYEPEVIVDGVTLSGVLNDEDDATLDDLTYADHANVIISRSAVAPSGYDFAGWHIRGDESGVLYQPEDSFRLPGDLAITLNGRETIILDAVYAQVQTASIVYDANGGEIVSEPDFGAPLEGDERAVTSWDEETDTATIEGLVNNSKVRLSDGTGFKREGATLTGWNTEPDGSGDHFDLIAEVGVDTKGSPVLYAEWKVKVTFDLGNDGASWGEDWIDYTEQSKQYTVMAFVNAHLPEPQGTINPPSGLSFEYWSLTEGGEAYHFESEIITEAITLYANWTDALLVPFKAVEVSESAVGFIDRSEWQTQNAFKLNQGSQDAIDFENPETYGVYIEVPEGYTLSYACIEGEEATHVTRLWNKDGEAMVAIIAGEGETGTEEETELSSEKSLLLVYAEIIPEPITVHIQYVKEGENGKLTPIIGAETDTITYNGDPIELNGASVAQGQGIEVTTAPFLFGQENPDDFNIPPTLDDGAQMLALIYNRIGVGGAGAGTLAELEARSGDKTLQLAIRDLKLQWSFDGETWTAFEDQNQPTVYAIYRNRGWELEITKTIPTTTYNSAEKEFTLTISSMAITGESYDVEGTGYATIPATPMQGDNPGSIVLTVQDGSDVCILGLPEGDYTITETRNENYTLSAKAGTKGEAAADQTVTDSVVSLTLLADTRLELTNEPELICTVNGTGFYTLNEALTYVGEELGGTATIRMLVDYAMPETDALVIPSGYNITLDISNTNYHGASTGAAVLTRGQDFTTGAMFTNYGIFTIEHITLEGNSIQANDALVVNAGTLNVNAAATLQNAVNAGNGGAIRSTAGSVNLQGHLTGNTAGTGGAVYASGGSVTLAGGALAKNSAENGGAVYYAGEGAFTIESGSISENNASENGGAVYVDGGSVRITGGKVSTNTADAFGGAFFATSALIALSGSGIIEDNTALSGGGIYAESGTLSVTGSGSIKGNEATEGDGGAVYLGEGAITLSGGTLTENIAASGRGGAVYVDTATVAMTGGSVTGNRAVNGSAIFTNSGTANFSGGSITENDATQGGAVGIGRADVVLNFFGTPKITGNTMKGESSNVYLDQDADTIINTTTSQIGNGAVIGIYVPGEWTEDLFKHRGEAAASFASFPTTDVTYKTVFKNDRLPKLTVTANTDLRKLVWNLGLPVEMRYLASYQKGLPPEQTTPQYTNNAYYPTESAYAVSDLATEMYPLYKGKFGGYAAYVAFGGAFAAEDAKEYSDFITRVVWDSEQQNWLLIKRDGTPVTGKLILYYGLATYITIENNTTYSLNITDLFVLEHSAIDDSENNAGYGFVVARDSATADSLLPITASDLQLGAGHSIKLLFPGAVNQAYSVKGNFAGASDTVGYTIIDGTTTKTGEVGPSFDDLSGQTSKTNGGIVTIRFGGSKAICKIVTDGTLNPDSSEYAYSSEREEGASGGVEYTFATLNQAMAFIKKYKLNTASVEMLIDYLIPVSDVVTDIPNGYNITFTTATSGNFRYEGERATISRDTGNLQSIISTINTANSDTKLNIVNLTFDGKSLVGDINGGMVKTLDCNVAIQDAEFLNCIANNGGGVYIEFSGDAGNNQGSLEANNVRFENCRAKSTSSRQGGGGIWTDAAILSLSNCSFVNCTAYDQGGGVFHRVNDDYDTQTTMKNCTFENCEARAAGGFESDARHVTVEYSSFKNCIATQRNGGGMNIYSINRASPAASVRSTVTIKGCTFENCHAYNTSADGNGGGFRSTAVETTVENCTFTNTSARQGGAISASNTNATKLTVTGTTITGGSATQKGGGIFCNALVVHIGKEGSETDTSIDNCTAGISGGGIFHERGGIASSITLSNVRIADCVASNGTGGGLQTNAGTVSLIQSNVLNCRAFGNGGGINSADKTNNNSYIAMITLDGTLVQGNQSGGQGGGVYAANQMTMRNGTLVTGNQLTTDTAGNAAGVYLASMLTIGTANAETDTSSITGNMTVNGTPSDLRMRVNGSKNHEQSVSVLCNLSGRIDVVNAASRGTQFGLSTISYPQGFTDIRPVFNADDGSLYGIIDRADTNGTKIIWCTPPICKITDESGRLLFFDPYGDSPMIFDRLDIGNSKNNVTRTSAFGYLRNTEAKFYYKNGKEYTGDSFAVKMLVENYQLSQQIFATNTSRKVTLTTAGSSDSDYPYRGRAGSQATIIRASGFGGNMMKVESSLTLKAVTLDGGANSGITNLGRIISASGANANITLGVNAILQNAKVNDSTDGAGVYLESSSKLTIAGGMIRNCRARRGGGVYLTGNLGQVNFEAGSIVLCSASDRGGGICVQGGGTLNMTGGSITRSEAAWGGGVFVSNNNTSILRMSGGSITGNTATVYGGGIDAEGANTRLYFAGLVNVSGNSLTDGTACNLELRIDNNAIINSQGLYRGSVIGVYVPDGTTLYDKHGDEGKPFGTYTGDSTYLYCFVNDRNGLKGGLINGGAANTIYWVVVYSLEISKRVLSDDPRDMNSEYTFTVTLSGPSDNPDVTGETINGEKSIENNKSLYFTNGVAKVKLRNGESITADDLPTGIKYTVEEELTADQLAYYSVLPSQTISGTIGENLSRGDVAFKYVSRAAFTNLHAVCKITAPVNGSVLLYYRNADDDYIPAVYSKLSTAFETVNENTSLFYRDVYSDRWVQYTGDAESVEMLIPKYNMTDAITLKANTKQVALTTASPSARDGYPYVGSGTAVIQGNFNNRSMFTTQGSLTLKDIDLDGNQTRNSAQGGIVNVARNGVLTVTDGAVLENSITTAQGGAVYVADQGTMTITGKPVIRNNTANAGAGIYLAGTGSVLNLQDAPNFNNNTVTNADYTSKTNGGEGVYTDGKVRQDIYLANGSSTAAQNIVVTNDLTGEDGSIWVFAESRNHYKRHDQFAVMSGGSYKVTAFRNAQDDERTQNVSSSQYLTGVRKSDDSNVYWGIPNAVNLTIKKTVTGGMGDFTRQFKFTVFTKSGSGLKSNEKYAYTRTPADTGETGLNTLTVNENGQITFSLAHGESITLEDLPLDAEITIQEAHDLYTVTWLLEGQDDEETGDEYTFKLANDVTLSVTNNLEPVAPTGYSVTTLPYLFLLLAGAVLYLVSRKKRHTEGGDV